MQPIRLIGNRHLQFFGFPSVFSTLSNPCSSALLHRCSPFLQLFIPSVFWTLQPKCLINPDLQGQCRIPLSLIREGNHSRLSFPVQKGENPPWSNSILILPAWPALLSAFSSPPSISRPLSRSRFPSSTPGKHAETNTLTESKQFAPPHGEREGVEDQKAGMSGG